MTTAIVLDTETTDNKPETAEVIELAWRHFRFTDSIPASGTTSRFGFIREMSLGAIAAHHILPSEVHQLPAFVPDQDLPPPVDYWIGHNIDFDWKVLGQPKCRRICTLAMSRYIWPKLDSHTLSVMMYHTQGVTDETRGMLRSAHSAEADIRFVELLTRHIMEAAKIDDLDQLYEFSEESRIPRVMTFGKFKGESVGNVDRGYVKWYRSQPDPDPYLLEAFRRHGLM